MNRFFCSLLVTTALVLPSAGAQTTPGAPVTPVVKVSTDGQWEYLVLSFGKTYFSSPADIAAKQSGQSKLMIFGPLGGVVASEALDVQDQVDTLGRYGWELITVLGAIGGDQEWVFKRRFDPARAAGEAAQIRKEGDALAAAREQAAKDAAAKPVTPPTVLVDLDAQELSASRAAADQALREQVTGLLRVADWPTVRLDAAGLTAPPKGKVTVMLDVTERALTGNTYRLSAVYGLIEGYVQALKALGRGVTKSEYGLCMSGGVTVQIGASVRFGGEVREVLSPYSGTTYCLK